MSHIETLLNQIEQKRGELICVSLVHGVSSTSALKQSQELDQLLNVYQQLHEAND